MKIIDRAWELQYRIEPIVKNWFFKKIGVRFFVAMLMISFLGYAAMIALYFTLVEPVNLLTTQRIPFYLNPIQLVGFSIIVFLFLIFKKRALHKKVEANK